MTTALQKNGNPRWLICWYSNPRREKVEGFKDELKETVSLPYVQGVSQALKRVLKPVHIRTVMRPYQTLILVHPKDTVLDLERSNIVYCIPCADCSATCVGETKRKLGKRMHKHKRAVQKVDVEVSAIAEHV